MEKRGIRKDGRFEMGKFRYFAAFAKMDSLRRKMGIEV
jgi:hypothetical protein